MELSNVHLKFSSPKRRQNQRILQYIYNLNKHDKYDNIIGKFEIFSIQKVIFICLIILNQINLTFKRQPLPIHARPVIFFCLLFKNKFPIYFCYSFSYWVFSLLNINLHGHFYPCKFRKQLLNSHVRFFHCFYYLT